MSCSWSFLCEAVLIIPGSARSKSIESFSKGAAPHSDFCGGGWEHADNLTPGALSLHNPEFKIIIMRSPLLPPFNTAGKP